VSSTSPKACKPSRAATDEARGLGIFGSPTFAVGGEISWGDRRLEQRLERTVHVRAA
jgi:2-hydroxychromene-2-carboxylate isomerase